MKEKDLKIDRKKHLLYTKKAKAVIIKHLHEKYSDEETEIIWEKIQKRYQAFLEELPYLGWKKSTHNGGPGGTYDCILTFSYYDVLEDKPSLNELYEINNEEFLPNFERLNKIANLNNKTQIKIINKIFEITSNKDKKLEEECPTGYIMRVDKFDENKGINYKFYRCPIAEFAKANGFVDIMPAFCNSDYPGIEQMHGKLIRKYTCSNHDFCDYQIVGDKSDIAKKHIETTNEAGYIYNEDKEV